MNHFRSADMIKKYLNDNNVKVTNITIGKSPFSRFFVAESKSGKKMTFCDAKLSYPSDVYTAREIINNKSKTYEFAKKIGLTIPSSIYVQYDEINNNKLESFLRKNRCLVVKPDNGFQSRGLTLNIRSLDQLLAAIKDAWQFDNSSIIVQKQLIGEELRFISVDGRIRYVMLRQKPFVIGDGVSTISKLIQKEDKYRIKVFDTAVKYPLLKNILENVIVNNTSVPKSGEYVELGTGTMIKTGASIYNIIDKVDSSYVKLAEKLSRNFGNGVISVDIMVDDFKRPANDTNYALIEINTGISLPMCYSCRDGKQMTIIEDYIGPALIKSLNT